MKAAGAERRNRSAEYPGDGRPSAPEAPDAAGTGTVTPTQWLTSEQAGVRLGLGRNTLAEWRCDRRSNQPPFAKFGGKATRYGLAALDAWAQAQIVDPAAHSLT